MPEPTQGLQGQRYLYEIAVNMYLLADRPSVSIPLVLPPPDPSEQQNVLLHKIADAMYRVLAPGSTQPPAPCTDNVYLQNIAQNSVILNPSIQASAGETDQVFAYIWATNFIGYALSIAVVPMLAPPNQGEHINSLYYKLASLSWEIQNATP